MSWAGEERHTIDLGDKRLNERAVRLLEHRETDEQYPGLVQRLGRDAGGVSISEPRGPELGSDHDATLGGFLGRKGDGEPGAKTLWLGLQRVMDFAAGLRYARQIGAV